MGISRIKHEQEVAILVWDHIHRHKKVELSEQLKLRLEGWPLRLR